MTQFAEPPPSIMALLRKVKELAERGCDGERLVAQEKLCQLLRKHGVNLADLATEQKAWRDFSFSAKWEEKLLLQIVGMITAANTVKSRRYRYRRRLQFELTVLQHEEVRMAMAHYRKLYRKELSRLLIAFVHRHILFAPPTGDKSECTMSQEDLLAILGMMSGMDSNSWVRPRARLEVAS